MFVFSLCLGISIMAAILPLNKKIQNKKHEWEKQA